MIHDHKHGQHRFILRDDTVSPRLVRVLGSGWNKPAVEYYLNEGYDIEVGSPCTLNRPGVLEGLSKGDGGVLAVSIYPHVDKLPQECGGWRELHDLEVSIFRMQQLYLQFANQKTEDWNQDLTDELLEHYQSLPLSTLLEPFIVSQKWAAVFVAGLGNPRWYSSPGDPKDAVGVLNFLGLLSSMDYGDWIYSPNRMCTVALAGAVFGEDGPALPNVGTYENPLGWEFTKWTKEKGKEVTELPVGPLRKATDHTLALAARYIWSAWYALETKAVFDPKTVFDSKGVEFFLSHIQ